MDPARFAVLVRTLEERARRRPGLYRLQVAALASLGYLYVFGVLALVIGLIIGVGYLAVSIGGGGILVKALLPLLWLASVLLRSLWIKVPDLEGIPLPAAQYPTLAAAIERIRSQVDAPTFRRVLLYGDFNAAVSQRPRFGLLGPSVNDLVLGLPLMQALSPAEFDAVLAHEMGHVSRQHGRFTHWIYRIRATWSRLAHVIENDRRAGTGFVLGRFLNWYAPFFGAYTFVLARLDEYEADATAVRLAGQSAFATALVSIAVLSRFYSERHWQEIGAHLTSGGAMLDPHAEFPRRLARRLEPADTSRWLDEAMQQPTDLADTHPSLSDRLAAAGVRTTPEAPTAPFETAADALLGLAVAPLAAKLDQQWRSHVEPQLEAVRSQLEDAVQRLAELDAGTAPSADPAWERIELLDRLGRTVEAREAADELLRSSPHHPQALFFVGQQRLAADEVEGLALLQRAAAVHPAGAPAVYGLIFQYHWRHGRKEEAEAARTRAVQTEEQLADAARERASLAESPVLVPHGLPVEEIEPIATAMASIPGLRDVHLTRRVVVQMPELPCYLVGIAPEVRWWRFRRSNEAKKLLAAVMNATRWPEGAYFVVGEGPHTRLVRRMKRVAGSSLMARDGGDVAATVPPANLDALRDGMIRGRVGRRRKKVAAFAALTAVLLLIGWVLNRRDQVKAARSSITSQDHP